ncbi:hypothetical protein FRC03_011293 [Tulasnella sp. 419]|nr:hypothetical protein FRC03_011293 [Tulasnella sp. 419]
MNPTVVTHNKTRSSKNRRDRPRSVLDGVKGPPVYEEEGAAWRDSALKQLEEERLQVEALLEEKGAEEGRHFREIGKLVDEKMRAVFENTVLKDVYTH